LSEGRKKQGILSAFFCGSLLCHPVMAFYLKRPGCLQEKFMIRLDFFNLEALNQEVLLRPAVVDQLI
jgi:hypothetical protein